MTLLRPAPTRARPARTGPVALRSRTITDIAWSYGYPTWQLQPIAGLVAFYSEKVDILVDGERLGKDVMASPEAYRGLMKMETRTSSWYRSAVRSGS